MTRALRGLAILCALRGAGDLIRWPNQQFEEFRRNNVAAHGCVTGDWVRFHISMLMALEERKASRVR